MTTKIPHGTYSGYAWWNCRCELCRKAGHDYDQRRYRQIAYGRWSPHGDGDQVRAHIAALTEAGWSLLQIARESGVSGSGVRAVNAGGGVFAKTADAILSIPVGAPPFTGFIPAVGTVRRVRALTALGWTGVEIARRSGVARTRLLELRAGKSLVVFPVTYRRVRAVYEELAMVVPERSGASSKARLLAAREGWLPPLEWDDDWLDLSDEDLEAELKRLARLMDIPELRRCYTAHSEGDRSLLVVAGSERFLEWRREEKRARGAAA